MNDAPGAGSTRWEQGPSFIDAISGEAIENTPFASAEQEASCDTPGINQRVARAPASLRPSAAAGTTAVRQAARSGRDTARARVLCLQRVAGNRGVASALGAARRRVLQRQPWLATPQRWIDLDQEMQSLVQQAQASQTRPNNPRSGWTLLSAIESLFSEAQAQAGGVLPAHPAAGGAQAPITPAQLAALVIARGPAIRARITACLQFQEGWDARAFLKPLMTRVGWAPPVGGGWAGAIPAAPAGAELTRATALLATCRTNAGLADNDPYIRWGHIRNRHLAGDMLTSGFTELNPHANGFFPLMWTQPTVDAHIRLALQTPELARALAHAITDGMDWATTTVSVGGMAFTIGVVRGGAGNWAHANAHVQVNQFFPKLLPNIPFADIQAWRHANPRPAWFDWLRGQYHQPDN